MIQDNNLQNKNNKKYFIIFFAIIVAIIFVILLVVVGKHLNILHYEGKNGATEPTLIFTHNNPSFYISNQQLQFYTQNIIYVDEFRPSIILEFPLGFANNEFINLYLDDSLNVLGDDFYGITEFLSENRIKFSPNFVIIPGTHKIVIEYGGLNAEVIREETDFVLAYHEKFKKTIGESEVWMMPKSTPSEWFQIRDEKLVIVPMSGADIASLYFLYNIHGGVIIDFELMPLGENVSAVLYLIDTVRNVFVLGSNDNKRNLLYHRNSNESERIDGENFLLKKSIRYHIRLQRENNRYLFLIKELKKGESVDTGFSNDKFKQLITYFDKDKMKVQNEIPDCLGFSLWQNSDGVVIDDIYITHFGNDNK